MKIKEYLLTKKYDNLYYRLSYFFKYKIPFTKNWNEYHNPLNPWWKVRKVFKRPKIHFYVGKITWFFGFPCRKDYLNPIIDVRMSSLGWKDKYNSPRHEWDPYISIVFFRKWQLLWIFNWIKNKNDRNERVRSMATWEALLEYLYYNKSLSECVKSNIWGSSIDKDSEQITIRQNLK